MLNFIRAVWAEPALKLGCLRWEEGRRCLMVQKIFLSIRVPPLLSLCALPGSICCLCAGLTLNWAISDREMGHRHPSLWALPLQRWALCPQLG